MKIYCVRHGEAEEADINLERPLTECGRVGVEKLARFMGEAGLHVDHMLHSPKLRAVETAKLFARYLNADQINECATLLDEYNDVNPIIDMVPMWHGDTMLVGHLPFMYKLISGLVVQNADFYPIVNYPPGTVVCLDRYNDRWIISWVLNPSLIPGDTL
jgi:phosphohistidine phosphatase